jgi:hypothetical protein
VTQVSGSFLPKTQLMAERADAFTGVPARRRSGRRSAPLLAGAALALAAAVGVGVWLAVRDTDTSSAPVSERSGPAAVSVDGLMQLARERTVFWAGPMPGVTYELTNRGGRIHIRYLPAGTPVGTTQPRLSIGSYQVRNAFAVTSAAAKRRNSVTIDIGSRGVAFYDVRRPTNIYLAHKGSDVQVELYDPSASRAHQLVAGGQVGPVSADAGTSELDAKAASPAELRALVWSLRRPVYWLGTEAGTTYEVSGAPGGRIFVRYLPRGTRVGASKPYLTVATYPVREAFAVTRAASRTRGAVVIPLGGDSVAFYSRARPTNVYVAYRGVDFQVEVFDPSARRVHDLLAARRLKSVG